MFTNSIATKHHAGTQVNNNSYREAVSIRVWDFMLSLICQILHILWKRPPGFLNPSNTHSKTRRLYSNINQSVQLFASPAHIPTFIGPQKGPRKKNRPVQVAPPLSSVCHAQMLLHRRLRPRRRNRERCATGTAHAWENHQWQQEEDIR